jgi:hypothetical protein
MPVNSKDRRNALYLNTFQMEAKVTPRIVLGGEAQVIEFEHFTIQNKMMLLI